MAILTIRNVPDDLHARLRERARRNRRSLNQEVIVERAAADEASGAAASLARMRRVAEDTAAIRLRMEGLMAPDEIDDAINEGRA
jgi:plasmid stability protein